MEINERLTADYSQDVELLVSPLGFVRRLVFRSCQEYRKNIRCIFISLFFSVSLTLGLHIRRVVDWQAGFLASDTRSAVTLGPLFDAYLLNIGGQCLARSWSQYDQVHRWPPDPAVSRRVALPFVFPRHGNKLVGAVESTCSTQIKMVVYSV